MGTVMSVLFLYHLSRQIVTKVQRARRGAQTSNAKDPGTKPLTTAPEGSQGIQDRKVETLPRTVFFTTYPQPPS
jgi:hypothetical protein